jgi:hypothetical protein
VSKTIKEDMCHVSLLEDKKHSFVEAWCGHKHFVQNIQSFWMYLFYYRYVPNKKRDKLDKEGRGRNLYWL